MVKRRLRNWLTAATFQTVRASLVNVGRVRILLVLAAAHHPLAGAHAEVKACDRYAAIT